MLKLDTTKPVDVTGIGNAILDILAFMPEDFIREQGMNKGDMALIDEPRAKELSWQGRASCAAASLLNLYVEDGSGFFQVLRRIDSQWYGIDHTNVNAHACFQRT